MQGAKQKVKDMASAAKHHAQIYEAKVEEKAEKATARTEEEKEIAKERRKVKEAEAKADLHTSKARHVEEKLESKQQSCLHIPGVTSHHHYPPGAAPATAGGHYTTGYPETGHVGVMGHQSVGTAAGVTHHVPAHAPGHATTTTYPAQPPGRRLL